MEQTSPSKINMNFQEANLTGFVDCDVDEISIVIPQILQWVDDCMMTLSGIRRLRPNPFYELECTNAVRRYHEFLREYPKELDIDATIILGQPVNRPSSKDLWYTGALGDLPRIEESLKLWRRSLEKIVGLSTQST